jgi:hypothetical protein
VTQRLKISITFATHTDSQNPFRWRAHGSHNVASFAFPPKIGSTSFLATKHPMDVCTLTGWVMSSLGSQSVSTPLQDGLRFFHHLSPYLPQHALRLACPKLRQRHKVTTFHVIDNEYLRPTLSAGGNSARVGRSQTHPIHPLTFWSKPHSSFGLLRFTTVTSVHLR